MQGKTSFVLEHRLSTIHNADRIIVMHHGAVHEEGMHAERIEHEGLYARLHELQFASAIA